MNHKKIYTERLEIKVSKEQKKKMNKFAELNDLTINQLIRNAIDNLIGD